MRPIPALRVAAVVWLAAWLAASLCSVAVALSGGAEIVRTDATEIARSAVAEIVLTDGAPSPVAFAAPEGGLPRVRGTVAFGPRGLALDLVVEDGHFVGRQRAWRAGDGLLVNVAVPGADEGRATANVYGLGFSLEDGAPRGTLVFDAGSWPMRALPELTPAIDVDAAAGTARYRVEIPWAVVSRARPWLDERLGLNLVYVSRAADGARRFAKLVEDPDFDTERTPLRRFVPLRLRPSPGTGPLLALAVADRSPRDATDVEVFVRTPKPGPVTVKVRSSLVAGGRTLSRRKLRVVTSPDGSGACAGRATLRLPFSDFGDGSMLDGRPLRPAVPPGGDTFRIDASFDAGTKGRWPAAATEVVTTRSGVTLEVADGVADLALAPGTVDPRTAAVAWALRALVRRRDAEFAARVPRADPARVSALDADVDGLARALARKADVYAAPGLLPAGFESTADGSPQAFSLFAAEGLAGAPACDLLLALHGSGVDEIPFTKRYGDALGAPGLVVAGVRGRSLSDWYVGATEQDALDAIAAVKRIFPVRRVFVLGFSMGGYGAYRLALRHPGVFAGAVVLSGVPYQPWTEDPALDLRPLAAAAPEVPFLVVHGAADTALPIGPTDAFVEALRAAGHEVEYRRLDGAAHGDVDTMPIVREWLGRR